MSNSRSTPSPVSASVLDVFAYWKTTLNHARSILDARRRKLIHDRLDEGFSVDDLKTAVDGCKASPFHMGQNDRNHVYDDIALICRDASHVESFIAKAAARALNQFSPAARETIAAGERILAELRAKGEL